METRFMEARAQRTPERREQTTVRPRSLARMKEEQ